MENLKLSITITKDGKDKSVGFAFDKDNLTKKHFMERADGLVKTAVRYLQKEKVFD
ncbi:MAG: hypothetical protein JXB42_05120 [Deltaproteobacteria bacterium]|nr:hypothetical protein [Deltaproteobacteria bacterium]